jgi:hypothetical protein
MDVCVVMRTWLLLRWDMRSLIDPLIEPALHFRVERCCAPHGPGPFQLMS